MAGYDIFFTGFEGGKVDWPNSNSQALFVDDGNARTGEYYLRCFDGSASGAGSLTGPTPDAGQGITNSFATGVCRVLFRIEQTIDTDFPMIVGFSPFNDPITGCQLRIGAAMTVQIVAYGGQGGLSTEVLAIDTWYRADLTMTLTDNGSEASAAATCSIYTEAGVLLFTVTGSATGITASPDFPPPSLGNHQTTGGLYNISFDDWYSQIVEAQTPVFPAATRITRASATSMVASSWSGVYQNITNIPLGISTSGAIVSSVLDAQVKFSHTSAINLGLSGITGFNLYTTIKADADGDESILINNTQYTVGVVMAYPTYPYFYQQMGSLTNADFNSLTYGAQNRRTQVVTLAQQYIEVLHAGSNLPKELTGEESWKHNVITFVATGTFQEITGVGFRPQVILVKKYSGTNEAGFFKVGCNGGTQSRVINTTTVDPLAVMLITDDGFTIGPSFESGQTYIALCIQDGGIGVDCKYLRYGAFVGFPGAQALDTVTIKAAWEPDFVMVQGDDVLVYCSDQEIPGDSVPLDNTTTVVDYIDSLVSNGFTFGAELKSASVYYYFAIRMLFGLDDLFNYNQFIGTGASETVTGVDFQPAFVTGKIIDAVIPQWRSALVHTGADSSLWDETTTNTTGITALTTDGFSLDSSLSTDTIVTKWIAFKDEGEIVPGSLLPTSDAGPNQSVPAFDIVQMNGTAGAGNFPCADVTVLWTQVSGPGTAVFSNPAIDDPTVTFTISGVYVFRFTVNNGAGSATDDVTITITCANPVSVNAGTDQQALLGVTVQLDGTVVGTTGVTFLWTKVSGPGSVNFSSSAIQDPTAAFSLAGVYVLQLAATSICLTLADTVTITILNDCALPSADPDLE